MNSPENFLGPQRQPRPGEHATCFARAGWRYPVTTRLPEAENLEKS
jgi:hypothetical protein